MSNDPDNPLVRGLCPPPFLDVSKFPTTGGHIGGRLCSSVAPGITCCLPCPSTDWIYPPSFKVWYTVSQIISAVGVGVSVFLLLSWAVLPPDKSRRHYLSVCLVIGILLLGLAFVIPLGAKPQQCYNAVTPNDMSTSAACAASGTAIILGGLVTTVWIAVRALSMHLQICWDIVPGRRFFYSTLGIGWGISILFYVITMAVTGVSYRFGDTCHVNAKNSLADFWVPLLVLGGIAALLQSSTFLYCFKVYLANIWSDDANNTNNTGLPSYTSSGRTHSAKVVYQRVKKVLWLQWRSMTIVVFLVVDIIFFAIVWIELDKAVNEIGAGHGDHIMPFLACILVNPTLESRSKCYDLGQKALVPEKTSVAILLLLALAGVQTGLMMIRSSLWVAWADLLKRLFSRNKEFVSLDAKRLSADPRGMPMMHMGTPNRVQSANTAISVTDTFSSKDQNSPYLAQQQFERNYRQPRMSYSTPRPASSNSPRPTWDASDSYAPPNMPSVEPIRTNHHGQPPRPPHENMI